VFSEKSRQKTRQATREDRARFAFAISRGTRGPGPPGGAAGGGRVHNFKFDFETFVASELYKFPRCARVVWRGSPQRDGFGFERGPFEGVSL
jgi:hypothetical protein